MALGWLWWRAWVWRRAPRDLAWQVWHLVTSTFTLRGRRGTYYGTELALVAHLGPAGAAGLCVAGLAFGDIDLHFAWQVWHLATSTFTLHGRYGTGLALVARLGLAGAAGLCVAGVALGDIIGRHFAWQEWHLWHCSGLALARLGLAGRRGTLGLCVAGFHISLSLSLTFFL